MREPRRPGGGGPRRRDLPDRLRRARALRPALRRRPPWLYGIATNLLRHHFRRAGRRGELPPRPGDDFTEDALGRVEARALGPRLAAALREVAGIDRDALLLHAWAELTYTEIARATGIPVGTVRSRIHRARTRLRAHLDRNADERA